MTRIMPLIALSVTFLALGCTTSNAPQARQTPTSRQEQASSEYDAEGQAAYYNARRYVQDYLASSKTADVAEWDIPESTSGADISKEGKLYHVALPAKHGTLTRTFKVDLSQDKDGLWHRVSVR